jgi:hypothetical protein
MLYLCWSSCVERLSWYLEREAILEEFGWPSRSVAVQWMVQCEKSERKKRENENFHFRTLKSVGQFKHRRCRQNLQGTRNDIIADGLLVRTDYLVCAGVPSLDRLLLVREFWKKAGCEVGGRSFYTFDFFRNFTIPSCKFVSSCPFFSKPRWSTHLQIPHEARWDAYLSKDAKIVVYLWRVILWTPNWASKQWTIPFATKPVTYHQNLTFLT